MESEAAIRAALGAWRGREGAFAEAFGRTLAALEAGERARAIDLLLDLGEWGQARSAVLTWLLEWLDQLPQQATRTGAYCEPLWRSLANVSERNADGQLLEVFWQGLARLRPPKPKPGVLPLVGVPILNGLDHLRRLLASLDVPIDTLAIVDQSGGRSDPNSQALRLALDDLVVEGLPGVGRVRLARPFGNAGVASAWNQILLAFPEASLALIVNHDVVFPRGVLARALAAMDGSRPQFMALLPGSRAFSAFLLTALAWDGVGLFDERFYPAYCEDLDYRDRLLANPGVERVDGSFAHAAMDQSNPTGSRTLADEPGLARDNQRSFALNRLWYLHRQRGPGSQWSPAGAWRHRWLSQWS